MNRSQMVRRRAAGLLSLVLLTPVTFEASAGRPVRPPRPDPFERSRVELVRADGEEGPLTLEQDQVAITVTVVGLSNYEDPALGVPSIAYDYMHQVGERMIGKMTLCQVPFFHIVVKNNADQVLKIHGFEEGGPDEVIVALEDDRQNVFEATRKEAMKEYWHTVFRSVAASSTTSGLYETLTMAGDAAIPSIPVLTGRANILPGRTKTFYACFQYVTPTSTAKDLPLWFRDKSTLTLGLYDLPVARDEAGAVKKKTAFQFAFGVEEYLDHYIWEENPDQTKSIWVNVLDYSERVRGPTAPKRPTRAPTPESSTTAADASATAPTEPATASPETAAPPLTLKVGKVEPNDPQWGPALGAVTAWCTQHKRPGCDFAILALQGAEYDSPCAGFLHVEETTARMVSETCSPGVVASFMRSGETWWVTNVVVP